MEKYITIIYAALLFVAAPHLDIAQGVVKPAVVKIDGEVKTALRLGESDLKTFEQTEVIRKDKDGKDHKYNGVKLSSILDKAGVTLGPALKGKNLTKYVLISARDGYQVVFALAELDPIYADRQVILATKVDDKPFDAAEGPFRIIVQNEKKPARCIRQVTTIQIKSAN